ncbi:MAG: dCTP deaminase [Candidatus Aenigmatarchaeota archaeon]
MLLSDKKIKEYVKEGKIMITPFEESQLGPSSYDLRLGFKFRVFRNIGDAYIDPKSFNDELISKEESEDSIIYHYKYTDLFQLKSENSVFVIHPYEFVLASIYEYIKLSDNIAAQIQGRSSFARLGLIIHTSAGWIDPGYSGYLTLEMFNVNKKPIVLRPLMKISQISFFEVNSVEVPYYKRKTSKYMNEEGAESSKISKDFE